MLRFSWLLLSIGLACNLSADAETKKLEAELTVENAPWLARRTTASGFPCEVDVALTHACRRCHWEPTEHDAPLSFASWEEVQKLQDGKPVFKLMHQMLEANLMPPSDVVLTPKVERASADHKLVLLNWFAKGAPRADERCE